MNKKLLAIIAFFCFMGLSFVACGDDDDDNIDYEWIEYNDKIVADIDKDPRFTAITSESGNGKIYYRAIDFFAVTPTTTDNDTKTSVAKASFTPKIDKDGYPHFTDSIAIRYEGRFYRKDGSFYIFDTTEGDGNGRIARGRVGAFVPGFATMLQNMRLKDGEDEVEVCIPYKLGYNTSPPSNSGISVYTTLWFKIKLLDIYPLNPNEYN
ncbi:MAG: FKBP-type peptidyl-prolyl cis-trans isomerase [Dysgonomonas sp.]|nr:FKBP-type peptidyl-prolyl cis-trans isomerase [Dysgonomonas sp.]